jgi:predicted O-methyltransferase YrrM
MKTIVRQIWSRQDFFNGRGMLEIGCAWLSFGAIMALEHILNKEWKVLELGGGGSTVFFANRCASVKTIETDVKWLEMIKERTKDYKNVDIVFKTEAEAIEEIKAEPDESYDVILIDTGFNPDKSRPRRWLLALEAIPKVKKGGYLIIDNYLKFGNQNFPYDKGWEVYSFDDFGYSGRGTRILRKL